MVAIIMSVIRIDNDTNEQLKVISITIIVTLGLLVGMCHGYHHGPTILPTINLIGDHGDHHMA